MLGAYFKCYKQIYAADKALESYRNFYKNGDIVMVNDGGDINMQNIALKYI